MGGVGGRNLEEVGRWEGARESEDDKGEVRREREEEGQRKKERG